MSVIRYVWALPLLIFIQPCYAKSKSCWLSNDTLNFGQVSSKGGTASTTVRAYCNQYGYKKPVYLTMCLYSPPDWFQFNDSNRQLIQWTFPWSYLRYDLFYDPALTQKIDSKPDLSSIQCVSHTISPYQNNFSVDLPVYGKVYANQHLSVGWYQSVTMPVKIFYKFDDDEVPSIKKTLSSNRTAQNTFNVGAYYENTCTLTSIPDLDFGRVEKLNKTYTGSTVLSFSCPLNTSWRISLDQGQNYDGTYRRMRRDGYFIQYGLYKDATRNNPWDNTNTSQGVGTNGTQRIQIYGAVPPQNTKLPAGEYVDTVTVKITY